MAGLNPTAAALLGFLDAGELSGYELAKAAGEIIGDFWHVTRSQVYRELADMSARGLISPAGAGPRAKRPFRITQAGRAAFAEWVQRQPPLEQIRYPLLLTVSFGAWLGPERLLEFVHAHRAAHEAKLAGYHDLISAPGLDGYVHATVAFGIRYEEAVLAWMADLPAILAQSGPPAQPGADPSATGPSATDSGGTGGTTPVA